DYTSREFLEQKEEIAFLKVYLELEKLRFGEDFSFEIVGSDTGIGQVPTLVIQPFAENALKHGLFHKKGPKHLHITFEGQDPLICTIEDNGIGREAAANIQSRRHPTHHSFAMESIQKRMDLLSKKFDADFSVNIIDLTENGSSTGTRIVLQFPKVTA
ncbi:MAG: hypothetical protein AAF570_26960, partial [Bacteroidota bacterium]